MNAIYVWGIARALGGQVLLRIEDHDRVRSRAAFERALLEDLEWLGFSPDAGLHADRHGSATGLPVRQSDAPEVYEEALAALRRQGRVYACACSRKRIGGERYPGWCRDLRLADEPGRGLRVRLDPGVERFTDALLGPIEQVPSDQCGDLLVRDRDGHWTYQFAVCVDDYRQAITLIVRGADLLSSTGRQIALARMLGRTAPPVFLHHPLVAGPDGRKLSKSDGASGVRGLRKAGVTAPEVIGRAAAAVGLIEKPRAVAASAVADLFR